MTAGGVRQLGMFGEVVRPGGGRRFRIGPVPAAHGVPELPAIEVHEASLRRMCREVERDRRVYPGWGGAERWVAMVCGPLDAAGAGR